MWLRITAHEEILLVEEPLTIKYNGHKDQLSKKYWGMDRFRIQSLEKLWNISRPNIAVCGLNPHSGESGKIGTEEEKIILPAIQKLKTKNYNVFGPLSADTCFSKNKRQSYDGFICIYHDQGLIPVKTLDFFNSVNVTGGIPIIRTSPDHGPAFDIAELNQASNKSLIASIKLAESLSSAT